MKRLQILRNGNSKENHSLWDIRIHEDGVIVGEMIEAIEKVIYPLPKVTLDQTELEEIFSLKREETEIKKSSNDIILNYRKENGSSSTFLLKDFDENDSYRLLVIDIFKRFSGEDWPN